MTGPEGDQGSGARRHARFGADGLSCPLGEVTDLSAGGARIRCRGRATVSRGQVVELSLSAERQRIRVSGRVVWLKRQWWRGFEVGIEFVDVRPGVGAALVQLARFGFVEPEPARPAAKAAVRAAVEVEDLYRILGVRGDAPPDEIHAAYRMLALRYHPDRCAESDATERFTLIAKAYSILRNPELRQRYDRLVAGCAAA